METTIIQLIMKHQKTAYAIVNCDLEIVQVGGAVSTFFPAPEEVIQRALPEIVPEIIGSEATLDGIIAGQIPSFQLEHVNRLAPDGSTWYFSLTALPCQHDPAMVLIVLTDTSEQSKYAQMLSQQRNELRLLRRDLAQANEQLDFLLHHYISPQVVDALLERRIRPHPGGELRRVSVLFADLREYTSVAERLSPQQTMELVNTYLNVACDAIAGAGGAVTQFMGDAVMALFNAPDDQPDHALRAVQAGLAIHAQANALNRRKPTFVQDATDLPTLHFGVGIYSGPAVVGNVGARWRYGYSAIGDTTNVASRICSAARAGQVLIGRPTFDQVREYVVATPLYAVQLKGKSQPLDLFSVRALHPPERPSQSQAR